MCLKLEAYDSTVDSLLELVAKPIASLLFSFVTSFGSTINDNSLSIKNVVTFVRTDRSKG